MQHSHIHDIAIIGAGPVGLSLALALQQQGRMPLLLDARPGGQRSADKRIFALSYGSRVILEKLGAWPNHGSTEIKTIHVSQRGAFGRSVLEAADYRLPALGYVMPAELLLRALEARCEAQALPICYNSKLVSLQSHAASHPEHSDYIELRLDNGEVFRTRLAACAEGKLGNAHGATDTLGKHRDYAQHAILCRATPISAHRHIAYERFTPEGPIALLPLQQDFAVVWSVSPSHAERLLDLPEKEFRHALQEAFGHRIALSMSGERSRYPLALHYRPSPIGSRTVWLGNAAQTLHPVAGQGLNLALRDISDLIRTLQNATDCGKPAVLQAYAQARRLDRWGAITFTDALIRLFSTDHALLTPLRGMGLAMLDTLPPLRHFVAKRMIYGARAW